MGKKFWISGVVLSVLALILGFVVHGLLLKGEYTQLQSLYRTEQESADYFPFMILAHFLIGFGFTWLYRRGASSEGSWVTQGLKFGLAVALMGPIATYLIYYAVQPLPGMMVAKQILFDTPCMLLMGVVAAAINR